MSLISALYTGVSGLQSYGDALQVIGDNIANVNTTAFKSNRAEFADMLTQSISLSNGYGQLGRGVSLQNISANYAQGKLSNTERLTDLAINGNGFFVVSDGQRQYYTRNGQFSLNNQGELVTANGLNLVGYQYGPTGQPTGTFGPLQITQANTQPQVTGDGSTPGSGISIGMNLNSDDEIKTFDVNNTATTSNYSTNITTYDSLGAAHSLEIYFNKSANNEWQWHAMVDSSELQGGTAGTMTEGASGTLTFTDGGALQSETINSSSFNFTGTAQTIGFDFGDAIADGGTGLSATTQFAEDSVVHTQSQDGHSAGILQSIAVDDDGMISGIYSNGETLPIGQIALANFANLQGLAKAGSSIYVDTLESGSPVIGQANVGDYGSIASYSLELSNVDLATEFVNMISTQRAYQANSKVISTGSDLLNEVVNLIR